MRFFTTLAAIACAASLCQAQSLTDYLHLRSKYHIHQPISADDLDNLQGTKVVEIDGVVQGSFTSGSTTSLMLQRSNGQTQVVDCATAPEWLTNGEVAARLLIKASRGGPNDALKASLLEAATENSIRSVDDKYWKAEAAKRPVHRTATKALASRGGGRALYGWIGKAPTDGLHPNRDQVIQYARFVQRQNPQLTDQKAIDIANAILTFSLDYGVDSRLVVSVLMAESGFDPSSTSRSGAMGLGQLMPETAKWMGVQNPYDTRDNLYGTVKLLKTHLLQYKAQTGEDFYSLQLALAAYNAGEGAVRRHGGVPPYRETVAYVNKVIRIYRMLCGDR